jgi:hypothetical protein
MGIKIVQSFNMGEYRGALKDVKVGDFIYVHEWSNPHLIQVESADTEPRDHDYFTVKVLGKTISGYDDVPGPKRRIKIDSGPFYISENWKLVIGPFEELKQLFINDFIAPVNERKAEMDAQAAKELTKLEDAFE